MSLQIRLAMFYTILVGIVLVAFGGAVYARSTDILMDQVDVRLESAIKDAGEALLRRNDELITYDANIMLQLFNYDGDLVNATQASDVELGGKALDLEGMIYVLKNREPYSSELVSDDLHYKTLSAPVILDGTSEGVLQAGISLRFVDEIRADLLRSLLIIGLVITTISATFGYYTAHSALMPLAIVTQIATEITHSDDLTLRIPSGRQPPDEVGDLIFAFNETMGRLEHLFTAQRRFLADVSHELRTPLTVLQGNADLMRRMNTFDAEALENMSKEIARLTRMVEDLLLMAQAESGRLELAMAPVELDTLLLEVYQQARILAGERKHVHLVGIDQVQVLGDRDRLKQVLLNLVSNGIKYTRPDGNIYLEIYTTNGEVYISVRDDGIGIHPDDLAYIFERFYRAEKSRTRFIDYDQKGFGLGLSIAYWIMQRHDGRIEVESDYGHGATFRMCMPVLSPMASAQNGYPHIS